MTDTLRTLTKQDLAMFARHRIPPDILKAAGILRVTDKQARENYHLSAPRKCDLSGLTYLYRYPTDNSDPVTCRLRRDHPDIKDGKEENKYWSLTNGPRLLYRPPGFAEKLRNPETVIVLVEAEKSALGLTAWAERAPAKRSAWLPLAMGGCDGWSKDKAPIPDLEEVCRGRRVYIFLDANAATNTRVQQSRNKLATALRKMNCEVLIADVPQLKSVNGPDDLLALKDGDSLVEASLANAKEAVAAPYSDDALAARFSEHHENDVRYVKAWGSWLIWDGLRWKKDETQTVARLVQQMCEAAASECAHPAEAKSVRSARTRKAVQEEASVYGRLAATVDQWDADPMLLNTPGGTVDLPTGTLREARREDYCTKMTAVAPEQKKPLPWLRFLNQVTEDDKELQAFLLRMCGYSLTGDTSEHAMFFLYGTGANGKSVFVETIRGILGDYAQVASMDTFTATHNPTHPTDLAKLRGARLVTATETEDGTRWAEAKLKQITGGDRISARLMRQDFFEYTPQFKLLLSGNHRPSLRNVDEAMRRRLHLVPFAVTIPVAKRDKKLAHKLRKEWACILQWAVDGCLAWQKDGLAPPSVVTEATEDYLEGQDTLGIWLAENTVGDKNARANPTELYRAYRVWAETTHEWVWSQKQFSQKLEERGYELKKSHGARYVAGIRLSSAPVTGTVIPIDSQVARNKKFSKENR